MVRSTRLSKKIISVALRGKLDQLDKVNYEETKLDKNSFQQGYANGYVTGFCYVNNWILWLVIGLTIALIISITYNFI